jgi:hypothetical protein
VKFLREHGSDLDDRTVHNIFETLNTFLRTRDILIAGKILAELDYAEKPPKPYTKQELKDMFAAMGDLLPTTPGSPVFVFSPVLSGLLVIRESLIDSHKMRNTVRGFPGTSSQISSIAECK